MIFERLWLCVLKLVHKIVAPQPIFYTNLKKQRDEFCRRSFFHSKKEQVIQTAIFWEAFYETEPLILKLEQSDVLKAADKLHIDKNRVLILIAKRLGQTTHANQQP